MPNIPPAQQFKDEVEQPGYPCVERGGIVLMPAFSVGRSQSLLHAIQSLKAKGEIDPALPVYLNSPMAIDATETLYFRPEAGRFLEMAAACFPGLEVRTAFVTLDNGVYQLTARIAYPMNDQIPAALKDGVTLSFEIETQVLRQRRFWTDATVAARGVYHGMYASQFGGGDDAAA